MVRGKLYAEMGQYRSALVDLNFALRLQPTHAEAFAYRGFANLSLGKFPATVPDLELLRIRSDVWRECIFFAVRRSR